MSDTWFLMRYMVSVMYVVILGDMVEQSQMVSVSVKKLVWYCVLRLEDALLCAVSDPLLIDNNNSTFGSIAFYLCVLAAKSTTLY